MITAVILARESSSRFPRKHLQKLNTQTIFDNIIYNLKKSKFVSKIILATGNSRSNKKYIEFFKKKRLNSFCYNDEEDVTKRIYLLTKKLETKYCLVISGDCPVPDYRLINKFYTNLNKNRSYDFITTKKKTLHEGILLFKTEAWKEVYKNSNKKIYKENPGLILKKKKFRTLKIDVGKENFGKKLRLSIDTLSDLFFFRLVASKHNTKKFISFKNVVNSREFSVINNTVRQINPFQKNSKKIQIITTASPKYGLGHLSRARVIFDNLINKSYKNVRLVLYNSKINKEIIRFIEPLKFSKEIDTNSRILSIVDLPKNLLKNFLKKYSFNKNILIDQFIEKQNPKYISIIPTIRKLPNKINIKSGRRYLLLSKEILFYKLKKKIKRNYDNLFITGGSKHLSSDVINDIKMKKFTNYCVILGGYTNKKLLNYYKENKINFIVNPKNILELISTSNNIFCFFGVTTLEVLAFDKKPIILEEKKESLSRLKDIKYLYNKKLAMPYNLFKKNFKIKPEISNQKVDFDCKFLDKIIN